MPANDIKLDGEDMDVDYEALNRTMTLEDMEEIGHDP